MSKIKLRKEILKTRKAKYFEIKISKNIIKNIKKKVHFSSSSIIGGYYPINFEFNCLIILKKFFSEGYCVSLPVIKKNHQMDFYKWDVLDPLRISSFGIPEPKNLQKVYPDILFVPVVAYDGNNNRIGYGGGFYDRYIEKISKIKNCVTIGLAFSNQKVKKFKVGKYDKMLDFILTDKFIKK